MNTILISKEDSSANIIKGKFEARFVQRTSDYFIIYVSSHQGCNQACRFCHLTQTKQTDMTPASLQDYVDQVMDVLAYWRGNIPDGVEQLRKVNINFMARGEPLLNPTVINHFTALKNRITFEVQRQVKEAVGLDVCVQFNISTIFPKMDHSFMGSELYQNARQSDNVTFYYSLYSTNPEFRKRWLPKALAPYVALNLLSELNYKIHYALIAGENDSLMDAGSVCDLVNDSRIFISRGKRPDFNLVRYNPYSEVQGVEPSEDWIARYMDVIQRRNAFGTVKIVSRVGRDVYASCGTFLNIKD